MDYEYWISRARELEVERDRLRAELESAGKNPFPELWDGFRSKVSGETIFEMATRLTDERDEALAEAERLRQTLGTCSRHFGLLANLAKAPQIRDVNGPKRRKWQIVADEAIAGVDFINEALKTEHNASR